MVPEEPQNVTPQRTTIGAVKVLSGGTSGSHSVQACGSGVAAFVATLLWCETRRGRRGTAHRLLASLALRKPNGEMR
jgi:hypothetical protein